MEAVKWNIEFKPAESLTNKTKMKVWLMALCSG